mmetsp:Transcript_40043/g.85534  ORF Transcript_40043/g.85534 Transcript_40043/m.85534 type:complete len:225 (-) Transcript_40043:82-756(-)
MAAAMAAASAPPPRDSGSQVPHASRQPSKVEVESFSSSSSLLVALDRLGLLLRAKADLGGHLRHIQVAVAGKYIHLTSTAGEAPFHVGQGELCLPPCAHVDMQVLVADERVLELLLPRASEEVGRHSPVNAAPCGPNVVVCNQLEVEGAVVHLPRVHADVSLERIQLDLAPPLLLLPLLPERLHHQLHRPLRHRRRKVQAQVTSAMPLPELEPVLGVEPEGVRR